MDHAFVLVLCFWLVNIQKFVPLACLHWGDHAGALDGPAEDQEHRVIILVLVLFVSVLIFLAVVAPRH